MSVDGCYIEVLLVSPIDSLGIFRGLVGSYMFRQCIMFRTCSERTLILLLWTEILVVDFRLL